MKSVIAFLFEREKVDSEKRREELLKLLKKDDNPKSGTMLASYFNVTRQVIVNDVAILRAKSNEILSTNRGYILRDEDSNERVLKVRHDDEQIIEELYTIVDNGGKVIDVFVSHEIYGKISAELILSNRRDVDLFYEQLKAGKISPLKHLTDDYHYHTILVDSEEQFSHIKNELKRKGLLVP